MKKPIAEIRDDLTDVSNQISTQVRTLTLGVLAVAWLGLSGSDEVKALNLSGDWQLAAIALLCIFTLGVDLAQYRFGYEMVLETLLGAEKARQKQAAYSRKNRWYRRRLAAFAIKQVLAALAAIWLIAFVGTHVASSMRSKPPAAATQASPAVPTGAEPPRAVSPTVPPPPATRAAAPATQTQR